jgi:hypothetical protein
MRYRQFDLEAILGISVKAAGNDRISCMLAFAAKISRLSVRVAKGYENLGKLMR